MKRVLFILLTPLACAVGIWLLGTKVVGPRIEAWALEKLEETSNSSLPMTISAEKISLRFFKPSISVEKIKIHFKGDLQNSFQDIQIDNVRIFIDFFQLIAGRLALSGIVIDSPELNINLDPLLADQGPAKELPIDELFAYLEKIPLERVFIRQAKAHVYSEKEKIFTNLQQADFLLTNTNKNLTLKAQTPSLSMEHPRLGTLVGSFDTHLYLSRQSLRIIQLGLKLNESELSARGELSPIKDFAIKPKGLLSVSAKLKLHDIYQELQAVYGDLKIPKFSGNLDLESELRFEGTESLKAKGDISTSAVTLGQFKLGDAHIAGEFKNNTISFSDVHLQHPSGEAKLKNSQISFNDTMNFKAHVFVENMDLQKLFDSLSLKNIPVGLALAGEIPCEGQFSPSLQIQCSGVDLGAQNIWIHSSLRPGATKILDVEQLSAKGNVQITTEAVTYQADLQMGTSLGTSSGSIDFRKGFNIKYSTRELDFKYVKNLANLAMSGKAAIEGSTSGDSSGAIFDLKLNARTFIFEKFNLGNLLSEVSYRSGVLAFDDIVGAINKTQYLGNLQLDLNQNNLNGIFSVPTAELSDVVVALHDFYKFPLPIQGQGSVKAKISGPLSFWKMNYSLESGFDNVNVAGEGFDRLNASISAQNGNISMNNVKLLKGDSNVSLGGGISSEKIMNLTVDAKQWRLENSDIVSRINSNVVGNLNLSAEIKESVQAPQILVKGSVTDTSFQEQNIPNSNFIFNVSKSVIGGQVSLFGTHVVGDFQIPLVQGRAPFLLKMKAQDWNFATFLGLVGGANLAAEYESNITGQIDMRSDTGDIFKSSGTASISTFRLQRGDLSFNNTGPLQLESQNGVMTLRNFNLSGPSTSLQISGERFTTEKLNVSMAMRADLRLLQIFTPFLEDLGGEIQLSTTISGPLQKPTVLGNLLTRNAFAKLKGFPHPLEKLSIEVVFSQSKILVSSITGSLAGGTLTGDGGIIINGLQDLLTSIRLRLEDVSLNVPDKVRTSGNADLMLTGRWFPFVLSGSYHVASGMVEKEFTEESGVSDVRQSVYLPKIIREAQFEPIILDLHIIMDRNIPIKNSLLDGAVSGNIQVKGPPRNPVLLGRIDTNPKTKLIFKDKIFEIQNGVVDFADPNEINPNIYITAHSRIDEFDVTMIAQGTAKNLSIRLSSVPPLQENEIISLIALGVTSSNMDQNIQSRQQAEQLGAEIGGAVLTKPINKQLESVTGFNLSVTNQYDSTRNISVPKITLSRRLSDRLKVSGSRPVRDSQSYDLKLEYFINTNYTAIGSFESRGADDNSNIQSTQPASQNIFGIDLEFKREFK